MTPSLVRKVNLITNNTDHFAIVAGTVYGLNLTAVGGAGRALRRRGSTGLAPCSTVAAIGGLQPFGNNSTHPAGSHLQQ